MFYVLYVHFKVAWPSAGTIVMLSESHNKWTILFMFSPHAQVKVDGQLTPCTFQQSNYCTFPVMAHLFLAAEYTAVLRTWETCYLV